VQLLKQFYCARKLRHKLPQFIAVCVMDLSVGHCHSDIFPRTFPPPPERFPSPAVKAKMWKLALTHTPDLNRSTANNIVHVNGRSLFVVDWRMVVVVEGEMSEGDLSRGNIPIPLSWTDRRCDCTHCSVRRETLSGRHLRRLQHGGAGRVGIRDVTDW